MRKIIYYKTINIDWQDTAFLLSETEDYYITASYFSKDVPQTLKTVNKASVGDVQIFEVTYDNEEIK